MTDTNDITDINGEPTDGEVVAVSGEQAEASRGGFGYDHTFGASAAEEGVTDVDGDGVADIGDARTASEGAGEFDDVLSGTVGDVTEFAKANPDKVAALVEAEKAGKGRTTILALGDD